MGYLPTELAFQLLPEGLGWGGFPRSRVPGEGALVSRGHGREGHWVMGSHRELGLPARLFKPGRGGVGGGARGRGSKALIQGRPGEWVGHRIRSPGLLGSGPEEGWAKSYSPPQAQMQVSTRPGHGAGVMGVVNGASLGP